MDYTYVFAQEWRKNNEYDFNVDYIEKLLKKFNITKYSAVFNKYGGTDLQIELNLYKYKIEMDYENLCVNIKRGKMLYCSPKSSREFLPIKHTVREDLVWYDAIKWIAKDAK